MCIKNTIFLYVLTEVHTVLLDLGSDHLPIPLTVLLSPLQQMVPFLQFPESSLGHFDCHCSSAEDYSSLSSAAALITPLALNAAIFFIPFSHAKCQPQVWWSPQMEEAVSKRRNAFAAAHRTDDDRQAYISAFRYVLSVITKAKTETWQAIYWSLPNQLFSPPF